MASPQAAAFRDGLWNLISKALVDGIQLPEIEQLIKAEVRTTRVILGGYSKPDQRRTLLPEDDA